MGLGILILVPSHLQTHSLSSLSIPILFLINHFPISPAPICRLKSRDLEEGNDKGKGMALSLFFTGSSKHRK